jgi:hypothetical protein
MLYRCALCGDCYVWYSYGLVYNMGATHEELKTADREGLALLYEIGMYIHLPQFANTN